MSELDLAGSAAGGPPWIAQSWLRTDSFDGLAELNEQCLELMCEQTVSGGARPRPALLAELEPLWRGLDAAARRRAARCPFLLVDAGFTRAAHGSRPGDLGVRDRDWVVHGGPFFTVARTVPVTRLVLAYAWHLARSEGPAARLFLGISQLCAARLASCTLRQMMQLAENDPGLLKPRWPDRVHVWRELLVAAAGGDRVGTEQFRIRGLQLLAADARASDLSARDPSE